MQTNSDAHVKCARYSTVDGCTEELKIYSQILKRKVLIENPPTSFG